MGVTNASPAREKESFETGFLTTAVIYGEAAERRREVDDTLEVRAFAAVAYFETADRHEFQLKDEMELNPAGEYCREAYLSEPLATGFTLLTRW